MKLPINLELKLKSYKLKLLKNLPILAAFASISLASYKTGVAVEEYRNINSDLYTSALVQENLLCSSILNEKYFELNQCAEYLTKIDNFNDLLIKDVFDKSTRLLASKKYEDLNNIDIEDLKKSMIFVLYQEGKICEFSLSSCMFDRKECINTLDKVFLASYK